MVKNQFPMAPNTLTPDQMAVLRKRITETHPGARADERDGLRLDWGDRWVHIRSSNTEPLVRVIAEAPEAESARSLADQIGSWIRGAE